MARYVAFLRAVNVAGHGTVKMKDLQDAFAAAGARNVRTVIQSGNVLFELPSQGLASMLQRLRTKLRTVVGEEPELLVRTAADMERIVTLAPFTRSHTKPDAKLYVVFLAGSPRSIPTLPLSAPKEALDVLAMKNREVFVVSRPKKNGSFGFPNAFVEKEFGVAATSRNWTTVTKIADLIRE